jgi:hypothetical protein
MVCRRVFVQSVLVPPVQEKLCIDVSRLGRTAMHYVTHRSPPDPNTQVRRNVSRRAFSRICTGPTRAGRIVH